MEKRWSRKKQAKRAAGETRRAPVLDRVRAPEPEPEVVRQVDIPTAKAKITDPEPAINPVQPTVAKPVVEPAKPVAAPDIVAEHITPPEPDQPAPLAVPAPRVDPTPQSVAKAVAEVVKPEAEDVSLTSPPPEPLSVDRTQVDIWPQIKHFRVDRQHLERNRVITAARHDPAHSAFDVLRTKLLRALRDNGWTRIAITSPTEGCGKTFMAVNLALSLSRQANCRTVLMDLDMRRPSVAKVIGLTDPKSIGDFLRGEEDLKDFLQKAGPNDLKVGDNIAVGGNGRREDYASELLQLPETAETLNNLEAQLKPDVILFDMPPALVNDDVLAARPLFDGVLLIVGGGITKPQQVRDVERRLGAETPLLGVVMNRSEGEMAQSYSY